MNATELIKEAYTEVMAELESEMSDMTPTDDDQLMGDKSTQLAQAKGELATILDRAAQEGIIKRGEKTSILNKNEYIKRIGDLPRRIKQLQVELEPDDNL